MKESNWKDCIESKNAIKISPDNEKANSLIETSEERIKQTANINEKNANFIFEDYYSSILELLHAIVLKKGYKINNHICLGYYLRDILKQERSFLIFDDLRYKRNSLTYYGIRMEFDVAVQAINKSKELIKEIKKII